MPYSHDLRKHVLAAYDSGNFTRKEIAHTFGVCVSFIDDLRRRRSQTGSIAPKPKGHRHRKIDAAAMIVLEAELAEHSDRILPELQALLRERCGIEVSTSAVGKTLRKAGYTRKKKRYMPPSARAKTSVANGQSLPK